MRIFQSEQTMIDKRRVQVCNNAIDAALKTTMSSSERRGEITSGNISPSRVTLDSVLLESVS
jgi:hypothetical protein